MDVRVTFKICERQHATEEGDAAEDNEDPTDDRNRKWPPFHGPQIIRILDGFTNLIESCVYKRERRHQVPRRLSHRRQA